MIALNILDIKNTMAELLIQSSFDRFYLEEVQVTTFASLKINGKRNPEWYDSEEQEKELSRLLRWEEVKSYVFQYIKGKKTPTSFSISLKLCKEDADRLIDDSKVLQMVRDEKIDFLIHFRFEREKLSVVTGSSQKEFIIDKMPDYTWDMSVRRLMKMLNITYE